MRLALLIVTLATIVLIAAATVAKAAATRPPITNQGIPMPTTQVCREPAADYALFELRGSGVCWLVFPEATQQP
jgi:hypothetical protein